MPPIKHILFPCDFSKQCSLAVPFVRGIAGRFNAKVTLFSVARRPGADLSDDMDSAEMAAESKARLEKMAAEDFAGIPVQSVMEWGEPGPRIVSFAESNGVDLIMMPTHGYDLVHTLVIGSVTSKVLHNATCPVWTATYAEEQQPAGLPRKVLCAVDGSPRSLQLLPWASEFCRQVGAELKLIHATLRVSDAPMLASEKALQEEMIRAADSKIRALMRTAAIEAPLEVAAGGIADVVTAAAAEEHADLVLIGRGSAQATFGRLRTHAYGIISKSPCPVMSV